tara:strand:- start:10461 stop:10790 length:330 start_codon:yes stop_codon:yes gene_type:complete
MLNSGGSEVFSSCHCFFIPGPASCEERRTEDSLTQSQGDFRMPGFFEMMILSSILLIGVFPCWMICSKAGFPGWISLLILFPVLNIGLLFFLAFAEWPALKERTKQENA